MAKTYLDDLEDLYADIVAGKSKTIPLEEVMKEMVTEGFSLQTRPTTSPNTEKALHEGKR